MAVACGAAVAAAGRAALDAVRAVLAAAGIATAVT